MYYTPNNKLDLLAEVTLSESIQLQLQLEAKTKNKSVEMVKKDAECNEYWIKSATQASNLLNEIC